MPSISEIQSDADTVLQSPQPQQSANGGVASDVPVESGDAVPEPQTLPDICNLDWQREGMPDTEFNRKYPPDPWGEEMGPNARVWKVYRDQQDLGHNGMLESWNKTLDVLLIFAGLFSAVLTAFLIESYRALQPDYTQYVAVFLYAAAVSHNRTGAIFPAFDTIISPDRFIQTSIAQRWTNGLWFSSLVISLAVALLCILIKQWLDAYNTHVSAPASSPIHWARRHSLYHYGLQRWGVPGLISLLPLFLHLSLFLFFVGLILFLLPLDGAISNSLLVIVSCVGTFYALSLVLPLWRVECPSYTPQLAQTVLAVSQALSGTLHGVRLLRWKLYRSGLRVLSALSDLVERAEKWLESIQLPARRELALEALTISKCKWDLDGYVLSSLIRQPTDTHGDIINAAWVAIGAVTSTRTIDSLYGQWLEDALRDKLQHCFDNIPHTASGFAHTLYAQLLRARVTAHIAFIRDARCTGNFATDIQLCWSLGIDGSFLEVLDHSFHRLTLLHTNFIIDGLKSLPMDGDRSRGFPLRSLCLTFMESRCDFPLDENEDSPLLCTLLLVFCGGRFGSADMHELVRALRSMETALRIQCNIDIPVHNGGEPDYIFAVVSGLWTLLADFEKYRVNTATARTVAHQAMACFTRVSRPDFSFTWAQLSSLSTFIRSTSFGRCVAGDSLDNYILTIQDMWTVSRTAMPLDYWECIATLSQMGPDRMAHHCCGFSAGRYRNWSFFKVERSDPCPRFGKGSPYATEDDRFEPALSAFLDSPNAISTWSRVSQPNLQFYDQLSSLARLISLVLCRRQRLGRTNDSFVRGFFSGSFLFALFRDFAYQEHDREFTEIPLLELSKHCVHLSPERFMAIIALLEETGDPGSCVQARAAAFAKRLREGIMPGGELSGECAADCDCVIQSASVDAERGWGDVWNDLVTRFLRGRTESGTPEHV